MAKTIVVTGASRGIGAEIAYLAARQGYNVVINYNKSEQKALELKSRIAGFSKNCIAVKADISDKYQVDFLKKKTEEVFGGADILVNNAGISSFSVFTDITEELWDETFRVNVKGAFLASKAFLPYMIREKWGRIINISSVWGEHGSSCEVHYSASKAALCGFTKALAKELGPCNITVNCVTPGVIDTDMNRTLTNEDILQLKDQTPLCRIGKPYEVAESVLFLASEKASFITGQILGVNGGFAV